MAIALCILKWIGIVLVAILLLLLLLCLQILFVPIRYELKGSYVSEDKSYYVAVHWLYHIVSLNKKENSNQFVLRIFGIPFRKWGETAMAEEVKEDAQKGLIEMTKPLPDEQEKKDKKTIEKKKKVRSKKKKKEKKREKKKSKISFLFHKISSIIKFIREKGTKRVIKTIKRELVLLCKHILPKKIGGWVRFGLGDPALTGLALGVASWFPVTYQKGVQVTPDFEERFFAAEGYVKGRVQVFFLLRMFLRLYQNKDIKDLLVRYKNLKEEMNYGR